MGWCIVLLDDDGGAAVGIESKVSHCVVTTTSPEFLGGCGGGCCLGATGIGGKCPTDRLDLGNGWFGEAALPCPFECFCSAGGCSGIEFLIFKTSRASTYFWTLFTCIFLCNFTSPSAIIPSNLSSWFISNSIRFNIVFSATFPPLEITDSSADTWPPTKS